MEPRDDDAPEFVDSREAPEVVYPYKQSSPPLQPYSQPPGGVNYGGPHANKHRPVEEQKRPDEQRRIAGLPTWAFWVVVAVVGLVIVGASVGGGVGGTVGSKGGDASPTVTATVAIQSQSQTSSLPPSSSTASTGTSASAAQYTADTVFTYGTSDCPDSDKDQYTPNGAGGGTSDYTFTKNCAMQLMTAGMDITEAFVPSFDLCIDMCSSWNYYEYASDDHPGAQKCVAAVFRPGGVPPGNCWIKNSSALANGLRPNGEQDTATLDGA